LCPFVFSNARRLRNQTSLEYLRLTSLPKRSPFSPKKPPLLFARYFLRRPLSLFSGAPRRTFLGNFTHLFESKCFVSLFCPSMVFFFNLPPFSAMTPRRRPTSVDENTVIEPVPWRQRPPFPLSAANRSCKLVAREIQFYDFSSPMILLLCCPYSPIRVSSSKGTTACCDGGSVFRSVHFLFISPCDPSFFPSPPPDPPFLVWLQSRPALNMIASGFVFLFFTPVSSFWAIFAAFPGLSLTTTWRCKRPSSFYVSGFLLPVAVFPLSPHWRKNLRRSEDLRGVSSVVIL